MTREGLHQILTPTNLSKEVCLCDKHLLRFCPCCSHIFGCKEAECSICPMSCSLKDKMVLNLDVSEFKKARITVKEGMCMPCCIKIFKDF